MSLRPVDRTVGPSGSRIGIREAGSGPTIVFLHGLGGSRTAWEAQLHTLSDRFHCVAWDMPGYGVSDTIEPLTFTAISRSVVDLLDRLDVERAHLVGLSFGGQQALHVALDHPERVARLVLADTSARFGADGTDPGDWVRGRMAPLDAGATPADVAPAVLDAIAGPTFGGSERRRAIDAFSRISTAGLAAAVRCLPTHDVEARLGEVEATTLVVVGALDDETPVEYSRVLARGITDARLEIVPDVGHLAPAEAPDRFSRLVADFLLA